MNNETLNKVRTSLYAMSIENSYKNVTYFSGWVIQKPRIIKHDKTGKESVSLILVQFMRDAKGYAYIKTYNLISYVSTVVDQWKKQENICFVLCNCQLQYNSVRKQYYPQIYEMKIHTELDYLKLEEESEN